MSPTQLSTQSSPSATLDSDSSERSDNYMKVWGDPYLSYNLIPPVQRLDGIAILALPSAIYCQANRL